MTGDTRPTPFHPLQSLLPPGAEPPAKLTVARGERLFVGLNVLQVGQEQALHTHDDQDKAYVVLEGEGNFTVGSETRRCGAGAIIWASSGEVHGVTNPGPRRLVFLTAMAPPPAASRSTR